MRCGRERPREGRVDPLVGVLGRLFRSGLSPGVCGGLLPVLWREPLFPVSLLTRDSGWGRPPRARLRVSRNRRVPCRVGHRRGLLPGRACSPRVAQPFAWFTVVVSCSAVPFSLGTKPTAWCIIVVYCPAARFPQSLTQPAAWVTVVVFCPAARFPQPPRARLRVFAPL